MNNYFFDLQKKSKNSFDDYSNSVSDIINFYKIKYGQISSALKNNTPLNQEDFDLLIKTKPETLNIARFRPFEAYIIAFIYAMTKQYNESIYVFNICSGMLVSKSIPAQVNKIFILLQIGQLYEREGLFKNALLTLVDAYKLFYFNKKIQLKVSNFYASCCTSIGLLYYRVYRKENIAGMLFHKAITIRAKYRQIYQSCIYQNYISTVYRYAAISYYKNKTDIYIYLKQAFAIRKNLLDQFKDEYTKKEFIYTANDFLVYLIRNNYPIKYINKMNKSIYRTTSLLNESSKAEMSEYIINICIINSKYYLYKDISHFFKWYSMSVYFNNKYNLKKTIAFSNSEYIYNILK